MSDTVLRATVTALHALLARADGGDKDGDNSKRSSASPSKTSNAKSTGTGKASDSGTKNGGSWIYSHVDLVVAASLCGVVAVMISLILVWWYLKMKHKKAQAAMDALEKGDTGSEFESKGPDVMTPLPSQAQQQADYSMYPHFNASKPPPPVQVSFDDASQDPQNAPQQPSHAYGKQIGGGYSLGAISERSEELEHMDEGLYGRNQQHQVQPDDQQQEYMREGAHQRSNSDPRDSYYYDDRQNSSANVGAGGLAPPSTMEDRDSMYSMQEKTRYI